MEETKRPTTPGGEQPDNQAERSERRRTYQPRIYVTCLASYNNGIRHGLWIDAHQTADELHCDITAMLDSSPMVGAEEWAIHDHEDFAGFEPHEYEDLNVVSRVANGVATYGEAFAAYVNWVGTDPATLTAFRQHYMGTYPNIDAWGREVWQEHGYHGQIDEFVDPRVHRYITVDYEQFVRDVAADWHIASGDDGVHVFAP